MKRLFGIVMAVVLALSLVCAAAEGVLFETKYFTLQLPDNWETDFEDLEKDDEGEDLGFFFEPADIGLACATSLVYDEGMKDISLFDLDEETIQDYVDGTLEWLADENPEYLGMVTATPDPNLKAIPLVLFKVSDDEGEYIYADTTTNGYTIQFMFFVTDVEGDKLYPITDAYIEQIKTILATLKPAT